MKYNEQNELTSKTDIDLKSRLAALGEFGQLGWWVGLGIEQERKKEKTHGYGKMCGDCGGEGGWGVGGGVWGINGDGRRLDLVR